MKGFPNGNVSMVQEAVRLGAAFRGFFETSIPADSSIYFSVKLGAKSTALYDRVVSANRDGVRYEILSGGTITGYGASAIISNMNQNLPIASAHQLRQCTVTGPGSIIDLDIVRGSSQGSHSNGSTFTPSDGDFRIFKPNQEIIVRAVNPSATDPANFLLYYKWFEFDWP